MTLWSAFQQPHISANRGMADEKSLPPKTRTINCSDCPSHSFAVSRGPEKTSTASQQDMGWRAQRTCSLLPVAGKVFLLTLPFIERANRRSGIGGECLQADVW